MKQLAEFMSKLAEISADVQSSLSEIDETIQGVAKINTNSKDIIEDSVKEELKRYQEAHKVASESNQTLHQAIQVHIANLKILSQSLAELQKSIPSMADMEPHDEAAIAEFQRIIGKVDEMKKQRSQLLDRIRADILSDDITKKLVLHKDKDMPEMFKAELKKHDTNIKYLEQNLAAQGNIIKAITEVNAK